MTRKEVPDVVTAMRTAGAWLRSEQNLNFVAIGHRVVHGGPQYDRPTLVNEKVLTDLERYVSLAPLHQPNNLAPIRILLERFPGLAAGRLFRHRVSSRPSAVADRYAIPERLYAEGVRRYGFHGLSYEYVAERLRELVPDRAEAGSSSPISAAARRCARSRMAAASRAPWASPRSTACRWGRGRARSIQASCSIC